jgi:hypothetical protein
MSSEVPGKEHPEVRRFLERSGVVLRNAPKQLAETDSAFQWSAGVIAGVIAGSIVLIIALWVGYRYMVWKPHTRARRVGSPASPKTATSEEETQRLVAGNST